MAETRGLFAASRWAGPHRTLPGSRKLTGLFWTGLEKGAPSPDLTAGVPRLGGDSEGRVGGNEIMFLGAEVSRTRPAGAPPLQL